MRAEIKLGLPVKRKIIVSDRLYHWHHPLGPSQRRWIRRRLREPGCRLGEQRSLLATLAWDTPKGKADYDRLGEFVRDIFSDWSADEHAD